MRVLEKEVVSSYSMGKKNKHKLRKSVGNENSDSSEEVSGRGCVHVNKAVNFSTMKKGLGKQVFGECAGCAKDIAKKGEPKTLMDHLEGATSSDFIEEVEQTLWVCLQCGNQGCGRTSPEKHALKHYETPRSSQHNVVINMSTWTAWCYDCDDELLPEKYKKVAECMEHIKKLACVPSIDTSQGKNSNGGPSSVTDPVLNKGRPLSGKGAAAGCNKVKGLSNLGNTCFFNAVMQNLVQTYSLENLLCERKKGHPLKLQSDLFIDLDSCSSSDEGDHDRNQKNVLKDLPAIEVGISDPGPLTHALVVFLHDINTASRSGCINPSALFGQVCKKAPRFKGMQQQDSHELLRYLMDNMKTEEIKRGQSGILKHFKLSENTNPKKVDDEVKLRVKAYGRQIKHTFVECLFGGQLISTVICEECRYISQVLEPFLDLSLPVTEEKPQRPNQLHGTRKKDSSTDIKEESASKGVEGTASKDEKMSKHQSKKMKKKQKRDARRAGAGGGKSKGGGEGDEKEDDNEEKEEETEEKGEGDTEKGADQEEKYDASDADVEDNLESDTSRCYNKTLSDSIVGSLDDTIVESPEEGPTMSHELDISAYRLDTSVDNSSIKVETNIENCPLSHDQSHDCSKSLQASGLDKSKLNGPMNEVVTNGCDNEDVNVTYTLMNGCLKENGAQAVKDESVVDVSYTFTCKTLVNGVCNGDIGTEGDNSGENLVDRKESIKKSESDIKTSQQVNGDIANEMTIENEKIENEEVKCKSDKSVSDLTSSVSTLSIGDVSSSLPSDLSQMTLKDETEDDKESKKHKVESLNLENKITAVNTDNANSGDQTVVNGDIHGNVQCKYIVSLSPTSKHNKFKEFQKEGRRKSVNTLAERYHPTSGECSIESCLNQFTAAELLTGNNKFGCKNCNKLKYKNNPNKEKKEAVYSNANKQYLIFQPPAVLTLHLKRFEQVGFSSRKVNRHVDFPFVLDIAPYCSSLTQGIKPGQKKILYSLYGVVEHSGRLTSGHYTAYVKVRPNIGTLNNFLNKHNVTLKEYLNTYAQHVMNGDRQEVDMGDDVSLEGLVPPGRWYHISDSRVNEVTEASVERAQAYLLFYERIY